MNKPPRVLVVDADVNVASTHPLFILHVATYRLEHHIEPQVPFELWLAWHRDFLIRGPGFVPATAADADACAVA